jgi:hypothetical protein
MDYLTNYYRNLCEQLQERINMLEAIRSPAELLAQGNKAFQDEVNAETMPASEREQPNFPDSAPNRSYAAYRGRADRRASLINAAAARLSSAAGDTETLRQFGDVMADINNPYGSKVAGMRDLVDMDARARAEAEEEGNDSAFEAPSPSQSTSARLLAQREQDRQAGLAARAAGQNVNVAPDIAAMRKFIQLGKGTYTPPGYSAAKHDTNPTDNVPVYVDPRTAAIRQQSPLKRNSPDANPGRIL